MENGGGAVREEVEGGAGVLSAAAAAAAAVIGGGERAVIRWERFLPRRSLRVMLVEHDDSTRHVVTALLRKCSYHVAAVADGLKAWEVMREKHYNFDLVLTEVEMPSLSGIGLLTKIMGAEECKNIPVIMMSSQDSVGVVLKCMLKGAVDFLVKPVRKNELRNLWQHVWRRHCSTSYANASDNNAASNHISANADNRSKTGENNEEQSDAQSSGSKPDPEIESAPKQTEPEDRRSTREVEAKERQPDNDMPILASASKMDGGGETRDKFMAIGIRNNLPIQDTHIIEKNHKQNQSSTLSSFGEEGPGLVKTVDAEKVDSNLCFQEGAQNELVQNMHGFVEPRSSGQCSYAVLKDAAFLDNGLSGTEKLSNVKSSSNCGSSPIWELSLKRPQLNDVVNREFKEFKERHVLNHSNASAFSRYGDRRINPSYHKSVSSGLCIRLRESVNNCHSYVSSRGTDNEKSTSFSHMEKQLSSSQGNIGETTICFQVSSNGNMENASVRSSAPEAEEYCASQSATRDDTVCRHPSFGFVPLPIPVGAIPYQSLCPGYGAILQPMFYPESSLAPHCSGAVEKEMIQIPADESGHHENSLINNSHSEVHRCEENHHSYHWRQAVDSETGGQRDLSSNPVEQAYQTGSCGQDILKNSGSNGSGEAADGAANAGTALESGNESGVQNCSRKGLDCDRSRREAALIKFRLKRKDRCFEKKVRYYSRKKLAEQRPRVKGQFVRQKIPESTTATDAED